MNRKSFLFSSAILLLHLCGALSICRWTFDNCIRVGEFWTMQCNVTLLFLTPSLKRCDRSRKPKTVYLDSDEGTKYDRYCNIKKSCAIIPTWCSWEAWTIPDPQCGMMQYAKRRRRKCCHPITKMNDSRVSCHGRDDYRTMELPEEPCLVEDDKSDLQSDRELFRDITIGCFCVLSVLLLIVCCRCCRGWKSRGLELSPPPPPHPPQSAPPTQPTPQPPEPVRRRPEPGRVIRAPSPPETRDTPPETDAPPAYRENDPLVSPPPPAYEDAQDIEPSSPPPRYETAITLVS